VGFTLFTHADCGYFQGTVILRPPRVIVLSQYYLHKHNIARQMVWQEKAASTAFLADSQVAKR
jgi:hypothetical protein